MKYLALFLISVLLISAAFAEEPHHQLTRIYIHEDAEIPLLLEHGLDIVQVARGEYVEVITIQEELDRLISAGFDVEVIIPDMEAFYQSRNDGRLSHLQRNGRQPVPVSRAVSRHHHRTVFHRAKLGEPRPLGDKNFR